MSKKQSNYGQHTIGELMQALKNALEENRYLTLDSPIMIADYNMSEINYEFDLLPSFSPVHRTAGLCLFHSLNEPVEEPKREVTEENVTTDVTSSEDKSIVKFAKWYKK